LIESIIHVLLVGFISIGNHERFRSILHYFLNTMSTTQKTTSPASSKSATSANQKAETIKAASTKTRYC